MISTILNIFTTNIIHHIVAKNNIFLTKKYDFLFSVEITKKRRLKSYKSVIAFAKISQKSRFF